MRRIVWLLVAGTLLALLLLVALHLGTAPNDVVVAHSSVLSQYFFPLEAGLVRSREVSVRTVGVQEPSALAAFTAAGNADLIEAPTTAAIVANATNPRLRIVGTLISTTRKDAVVVVRRDSPLLSLGDLRGRTVGVDSFTMVPTIVLKEVLQENYGVLYDSVRYVTAPLDSLLGSLDLGACDAAVLYSFYAYAATSQPERYRVLGYIFEESIPLAGTQPIAAVLVGDAAAVAARPYIFDALLLVAKSFAYADKHRESVAESIARTGTLPPEQILLSFLNVRPTQVTIAPEGSDGIKALARMCYHQGLITSEPIMEDLVLSR